MKKRFFIAMGIFCAGAAQAQVKLDMKPGLWEHKVKLSEQSDAAYNAEIKAAVEQMKKQLENLPPEQREALEKAMGGGECYGTGRGI